MNRNVPHVVIVGGGFGGLYCARSLRNANVRITLIDARNYHLFQPLLYQVATASLSPGDIASPLRFILRRQRNAEVWLGTVTDIDVAARTVRLTDTDVHYDYLVLATGATHAYFGHDEWQRDAPGLKTIEDATEIRTRFLLAFEIAEREADLRARQRLLTFAIVGGGPTGVELAGAMAEIARQVMPREFRSIDTASARILLLEGSDRILPGYTPVSSARAQRQLERLGVDVRTNALVTGISDDEVIVGAETIAAENVFWAAGVAASPLGATLGAELDRAGRVIVDDRCTITGHPEVFVIGDLASVQQDGQPVPGVAPAAMQMGEHVARQIRNDLSGRPRTAFRYRDKGSLATIGRAAAVAEIAGLKLSGFIAWLVWAFVHLLYLIGFRNRVLVLMQWGWSYLWFQRGMRLITGSTEIALARARSALGDRPAATKRKLR